MSQEVSSIITQYLLDTQPGLYKVLAATTGTDTTRFVHGPTGIHAQENPDGSWRWMAQDGLGSVTGVVDDNLNLLENRQYAPYGEVWEQNGTEQTNYQFTGEWGDENALLYLRARYLNPASGAFISLDPWETANRYSYVDANPVTRVDPTGFDYEAPVPTTGCPKRTVTCVASPVTGEQILDIYHSISRFNTYLTTKCEEGATDRWDIRYPGENNTWKADVLTAFGQINSKLAYLGLSFTRVFGPLEFRFVFSDTEAKYGRTINSKLVWWNESGIKAGAIAGVRSHEGFQRLILHEIGHVLEHRTRYLLDMGMYEVAMEGGLEEGRQQVIPPAVQVLGDRTPTDPGRVDETRETIADYFRFWIEGKDFTMGSDLQNRAASAYWYGGLILWNNAILDVVSQADLDSNPDLLQQSRIRINLFPAGEVVSSNGIRYWLNQAKA